MSLFGSEISYLNVGPQYIIWRLVFGVCARKGTLPNWANNRTTRLD
jgi:hypothetical protein